MSDFIRTSRHGCFRVRSNAWGQFLAPFPDPDATAELEPGALDRFELHPDLHRIPADLWSRWVQLAFHFAHLRQGDLEVSCRFLRKEDDRSQWRILVPRQEVSGGSVRIDSFDEAIDIATGELIATYPPEGWVPAGSSHSHNTMTLDRFSSTDDASELGCPGLHVVLSHINAAKGVYKPTASITANNRRFYLPDAAAVIDLTPTGDTFHPAVLEVVQPERSWDPLSPRGLHPRGWPQQWQREQAQRQERNSSPWLPDRLERQIEESSAIAARPIQAGDEGWEAMDYAFVQLYECLSEIATIREAHALNPADVLAEVQSALHTIFCHDDEPLFWTDCTPDSATSADPPPARALPAGEW